MLFRKTSRRDKLFREALTREGRSAKQVDRLEHFRSHFPWGTLSLWTLFAGVLIYVLYFSPWLMLTQVSIQGAERVPLSRLEDTVETFLHERRFGWWSQRNFFALPESTLEQLLREQYPLLASAEIEKIFPSRLEVRVEERGHLLLWCSGGPCYMIDQDGLALTNERLLYTLYEPWRLSIIDTSALSIQVGQSLEIGEYLRAFEEFFERSEASLGTKVKPEASTASKFSRELRLQTEAGWTLLINVDVPVEDTLVALKTFLDHRSTTQTEASPLVTVDVRVPGRIFFTIPNAVTGIEGEPEEAVAPSVPDSESQVDKKKKRDQNSKKEKQD